MSFMDDRDREPIPLRLITGGKEPPRQGKNWLADLKPWTMFTAQNKKLSNVDLFVFQVREKYANSTVLIVFFPKDEPQVRYFSTVDFSNEYILMDIIDEPEPDNRTDNDRRLEVNADIKKIDTVDAEAGRESLLQSNRHGEENLQTD